LALEHPALGSDQRVLCAAARACKAWRAAVQQCGVSNTDVKIDLQNSLLRWGSFASWLRKHAALVRSIKIIGEAELMAEYAHSPYHDEDDYDYGYSSHEMIRGLHKGTHCRIAQQLLQQALELATSQPAAAASPAAAAAAPSSHQQQQQQQQQGLQLASFSCSCLAIPGALAMLAALPAHSLTHLDLTLAFSLKRFHSGERDVPAVAPLLQRLSSLEHLRLNMSLTPPGFDSSLFRAPGVSGILATLPAHSLSHLDLTIRAGTNDSIDLAAVLSRLSLLQQLQLRSATDGQPPHPISLDIGSSLVSLGQLTRLTSLTLDGRGNCELMDQDEMLQHVLAQQPPLRELQLLGWYDDMQRANLAVLSQLEHLLVAGSSDVLISALPNSLQRLELAVESSGETMSAVLLLQQLQRLRRLQGFSEQQPLLHLTQLPALQHLALQYDMAWVAAAAAPAWPQLPQLQELLLEFRHDGIGTPTQQDMATILGGLAGCRNLTKLALMAGPRSSAGDGSIRTHPVAACSILAGLTQLQDLCIHSKSVLVVEDALGLSVLTTLTRLVLDGVGAGVGDVPATAIACSLKQLRHVDLQNCALGSMHCLAVVGRLTKLTVLRLEGNDGLTSERLMLLTRLSHLQELGVSEDAVDARAVRLFWAAVRGQQM
jgi:hypothetical protein